MSLFKYKAKRELKTSKEPKARLKRKKTKELIFVIQKHHARSLHYDLRLEVDGVLKSWAVPKEPSMSPAIKRLAVHVEDHPYDYKDFEGVIPSGYGAGTVKIWDQGTYEVLYPDGKDPQSVMRAGLKKGGLHILLKGKKLKGAFHLVKTKMGWLFFKGKEEKVFFPKEKITKGDLLEFYKKVAPKMLPYLKDRPVSLKRYPDGIEGIAFFQKNIVKPPAFLKTAKIKHGDKTVHYALIENEKSLEYLVNLGCIEFHPFSSRVASLQKPDFLTFDLDPKKAPFDSVIEIAKKLHHLLEKKRIPSYCKTSGGSGLHILVPLGAKYSYAEAIAFAKKTAEELHQLTKEISTLERSISKRGKKVYIDYGQNNLGQTVASVYSVRARAGAPVSTPLQWKEVKKGLDPKNFTIKTVLKRLKGKDFFLAILGKGAKLK